MNRKDYIRNYQRKWMQQRRQAWIDSQGGCCAKCGSTENLEVDHIDPKLKTMNPRDLWSRTGTIREKELENCKVLCNNCHKIKSGLERSLSVGPIVHGTNKGYNRKCRCSACKTAHSKSTSHYKKHPVGYIDRSFG